MESPDFKRALQPISAFDAIEETVQMGYRKKKLQEITYKKKKPHQLRSFKK